MPEERSCPEARASSLLIKAEQAWLMVEDPTRIAAAGAVRGKAGLPDSLRGAGRSWTEASGDSYGSRLCGSTAVLSGRWRARGQNNGQAFNDSARSVAV